MKAVRPVIASNRVICLQMKSVERQGERRKEIRTGWEEGFSGIGRIAQHVKEREERKEGNKERRKGWKYDFSDIGRIAEQIGRASCRERV